jgi:hypothetical protein
MRIEAIKELRELRELRECGVVRGEKLEVFPKPISPKMSP